MIVSPVAVADPLGIDETASPDSNTTTAAEASASSSAGGAGGNSTTVVNVFPVAPEDQGQTAQGDTAPITGAGNRDLWTGSDESVCPPGAAPSPACPAGSKP